MRWLAKTPEAAAAAISSVLLFSLFACIAHVAPWTLMLFTGGWIAVEFAEGVYGATLDALGRSYPARRR